MTLIFHPVSTVAGIFGSQFFSLSVMGSRVLWLALYSGFFWAISLLLTIILTLAVLISANEEVVDRNLRAIAEDRYNIE
jgi:hypothetical protein